MELKDAIKNTKEIYMSQSSLEMLLDFERVLDELDLYSFENWEDGELVAGPTIHRYWVECTFMWPRKKMPDPAGAARLLPYGCKIGYQKSSVKVPTAIKTPDDFRPGTRQGKLVDVDVWYVHIRMPQELVSDIESASVEIASEEYDLEDIQAAYQQDIDSNAFKDQANEEGVSNDVT